MCVIHYEVAHTLPGSLYTVNLQLFESMMFFVSSRFHSFSLFSNIFGFLQRHATLELLVFEVLGATMKYICHSVSEAKWNIANTMWLWASDASVHFLSSQNHILHWNLLHFGIRKIKDVGVRFLPHLCAAALAGTVSLGTLSATVMQRIVFHVPRHSSRRKQFIAWRLLPKSAAASLASKKCDHEKAISSLVAFFSDSFEASPRSDRGFGPEIYCTFADGPRCFPRLMLVLQNFSGSTIFAYFCTAQNSYS